MSNRKLILYISMSLDGFIATEDDDLSWLSKVEREGEDYGYEEFNNSVDTYIVGRRTYEIVCGFCDGAFPPAERHSCYVITRTPRQKENGVTFYTENLKKLLEELRQDEGKNIYCDGGAEIVKLLMEDNLIDEFRISVIPIMLGSGKRLFKGGTPMMDLKALPVVEYDSGLIQLRYERLGPS